MLIGRFVFGLYMATSCYALRFFVAIGCNILSFLVDSSCYVTGLFNYLCSFEFYRCSISFLLFFDIGVPDVDVGGRAPTPMRTLDVARLISSIPSGSADVSYYVMEDSATASRCLVTLVTLCDFRYSPLYLATMVVTVIVFVGMGITVIVVIVIPCVSTILSFVLAVAVV